VARSRPPHCLPASRGPRRSLLPSARGQQFIADLAHDWDTHVALDGGAYDQWVQAKTNITMAYLTRDDIPFHYALADAFTICDNRWGARPAVTCRRYVTARFIPNA
jgi:phospholipase C